MKGQDLDRLLIPEDSEEVEEREHAVDLRRARISGSEAFHLTKCSNYLVLESQPPHNIVNLLFTIAINPRFDKNYFKPGSDQSL